MVEYNLENGNRLSFIFDNITEYYTFKSIIDDYDINWTTISVGKVFDDANIEIRYIKDKRLNVMHGWFMKNFDYETHETLDLEEMKTKYVIDFAPFKSLLYDSKSNQEAKADAGKPQLTLVPRKIIFEIARVREYGNRKYGDPDNWKTVEKERYRDAAYRHFMAYLDDPTGVDEESGLPHLSHLCCNLAFLCELEDLK